MTFALVYANTMAHPARINVWTSLLGNTRKVDRAVIAVSKINDHCLCCQEVNLHVVQNISMPVLIG